MTKLSEIHRPRIDPQILKIMKENENNIITKLELD